MADIPDVSSDLNALNAAWMQGETVVMRYRYEDGDDGLVRVADPAVEPSGALTTLTNLSSTVNIPQAEMVQVGQRKFAHGVRMEEVRPVFNATVELMKWIRKRNARVNRRLPISRFSFEVRDNQTAEAIRRYEFNGFIRDRVLDGPVATEAVPVTVQPTIQVVEDTEPAWNEDEFDLAGKTTSAELPALNAVEDRWIQGETVELRFDEDEAANAAYNPVASIEDRLATLTRITMSKTHPQQNLAQIGSRRFAHGPPLSTITPRLYATAGLLTEVRSRMLRTNRMLPRHNYAFRCTDNSGRAANAGRLTAPFTGVIRDRDFDPPVTADGMPTELGLTIQVTDDEEREYL